MCMRYVGMYVMNLCFMDVCNVCMYVCMYVSMYVCMYACVHTYIDSYIYMLYIFSSFPSKTEYADREVTESARQQRA